MYHNCNRFLNGRTVGRKFSLQLPVVPEQGDPQPEEDTQAGGQAQSGAHLQGEYLLSATTTPQPAESLEGSRNKYGIGKFRPLISSDLHHGGKEEEEGELASQALRQLRARVEPEHREHHLGQRLLKTVIIHCRRKNKVY